MPEITISTLLELWNYELTPKISNVYKDWRIDYTDLTEAEFQLCLLQTVKTLFSDLKKSGQHRREEWNSGWGENLADIRRSGSLESISPKYFDKYEVIRYRQNYVRPLRSNVEKELLSALVHVLVDRYMQDKDSIYEFGCGTAHHLVGLSRLYPRKTFIGLDWAQSSQELIQEISHFDSSLKLTGHNFDFFNPDFSLEIPPHSGFMTIAALEQVGKNFEPFINFIISKKPEIVFHIEPIEETLDEENLLDYLSIAYFHKRNYLSGFLTYLRELENRQQLRILDVRRTFFGSLFIDGYSVIAWCPLLKNT